MIRQRINKLLNEKLKRKDSVRINIKLFTDIYKKKYFHFRSQSKVQQIAIIIAGLSGAILFAYLPLVIVKEPVRQINISENIAVKNPQKLFIPRFNLDMPIREAVVKGNDWEVYNDAVSWLKTSGTIDKGNIVLYAHNYKDSFGKIIQLGKNDLLTVSNGEKTKTFKVIRAYQTTPTDLSAVKETKDQLTLYTCSGWFDANRFVVIATPIE